MRQQRVKRRFAGLLTTALLAFGAHSVLAQNAELSAPNTAAILDIPEEFVLFSDRDPNIRRPTAIVNGDIVTRTDVDQRLALFIASNPEVQISAEELELLRMRVLRNLIDETLQIQEARANEITIPATDIVQTFGQVAERSGVPADEFAAYLRREGASDRSMMRQIEGELAWNRLLRRYVNPFVTVSDAEVQTIVDRLQASRGETEYRLAEIFLAATPATEQEVATNAQHLHTQIMQGGSFPAYARQYSEASTAAVGGDLGWIRPELLPPELARAVTQIPVGALSSPIPVAGGFSIIAVSDQRQILTSSARDAVLSLKQITITFDSSTGREAAEPRVAALTESVAVGGGCGTADAIAAELGGDIVQNDGVRLGDLPAALQQVVGSLQVGQATPPFGSITEGVRVLILCGRDDPPAVAEVDPEEIAAGIEDGRVNRRARRYLQDLRRDAVIEYR